MKSLKKSEYWLIGAAMILFFVFFYRISSWMPVTGDDWGYALGGMYHNPIAMAVHNYQTWSGRFLSELWGFTIASHKGIWNFANAGLFTGIFFLLILISRDLKIRFFTVLFAAFLMISVPDGVRMQTYTWIMGTTYVIPLFLFLVHVSILRRWIFEEEEMWGIASMCVLNLLIPLFMENAAALVVGADFLVLIYLWFTNRRKLKKMIVVTIFGIVGLLLIRFSPGALSRMARDHAAFSALSLGEKISRNWSYFIFFTFMQDAWLSGIFSISMILYLEKRGGKNRQIARPLQLIFVYGIIQSFGWQLIHWTDFGLFYVLSDIQIPHSVLLNTLGYGLETAAMFAAVLYFEEDHEMKWFLIFLYLCAMGADAVMLISPIFDARSSLYTLYLLMLFILVLVSRLSFPRLLSGVFAVCLLFFGGQYVYGYLKLYRTVSKVTAKRMEQIDYYRTFPEIEEGWFIAYPDQSIHSGNIDAEDTYHLDTFREYYHLNPNLKLNFYWLEDYSDEAIAKG